MVDYKKMYYSLFNAIGKSIELLQQAQLATEEIYISSEDDLLISQNENEDGDQT